MSDPLDSVDSQPGPATGPEPAGAGVGSAPIMNAEPESVGSKILRVVGERLARLIHPDPRTPTEYVGTFLATRINSKLGPESEDARLGEAIALCLDVISDGDLSDLPPAAHLGWAGIKFRFNRAKRAELPPQPKTAE